MECLFQAFQSQTCVNNFPTGEKKRMLFFLSICIRELINKMLFFLSICIRELTISESLPLVS